MHQSGNRLDFIDASYCGRHDTAFGACKNRCLFFDCIRASFHALDRVQLDMEFICCPEDRVCVARLLTLVVSLQGTSGSFNQVSFYSILHRHYDALPFLEKHGR